LAGVECNEEEMRLDGEAFKEAEQCALEDGVTAMGKMLVVLALWLDFDLLAPTTGRFFLMICCFLFLMVIEDLLNLDDLLLQIFFGLFDL